MTNEFFPLPALRAMLKACRDDLQKARSINTALTAKLATVNRRDQFHANYIASESAKLREAAQQEISAYLVKERTYQRFEKIKAQADFWTLPAFLSRAPDVPNLDLEGYNDSGNMVKLMKAQVALQRVTNLLLSMPRMTAESLAAIADTALSSGEWSTFGTAYSELSYRAAMNDDDARRVKYRLDTADIPDVTEAKTLLAEAQQIEEYLGYTLRSIANGEEDVGLRFEGYIKTGQDRDEAARQAALQHELDREAATVRWQMENTRPAA